MDNQRILFRMQFLFCFYLIFFDAIYAQNRTANDKITPFVGKFSFGVSPSYYDGFNGGNSPVSNIADLAKRAKMRGFRQLVIDQFMLDYKPNYELNNFKYFVETDSINILSLYLNTPANSHRSTDSITCTVNNSPVRYRSESFANLYESIWDDSLNGKTPINDNNYYAKYVYDLVKSYNKYVKVYEVWNAPDFSNSLNVERIKGDPGNWWDGNPSPCDLVYLRAPFTDYVRMLRITYEVVKSVDSTAVVALGSISRENFLDAVLRNTDNPDGGKVTSAYPLKGGAYFDVVGYQSLPQYTLKEWDDKLKIFKYFRHSDAGVAKVIDTKSKFGNILQKYGYNDTLYPRKQFMVSKVNIPRKQYNDRDFIGSVEAQRNFLMKLYIAGQKNDLKHVNLYTIGDTRDESASTSDLEGNDLMGLYYNLNKATTATATLNQSGVGVKTMVSLLEKYDYNVTMTDSLKLNSKVDGAVFMNGVDTLIVLWVKTTTDLSEVSNVSYTLPSLFASNTSLLDMYPWDYSSTGIISQQSGSTLNLTSSPIIIKLNIYTGVDDEKLAKTYFNIYPNPAQKTAVISRQSENANTYLRVTDISGRQLYELPMESTELQLDLRMFEPGIYQVSLRNENGVRVQKLVIE